MASTTQFTITDTWLELASGPGIVAIQIRSQGESEFYVSDTAPSANENGVITSSDLPNHPHDISFGGLPPSARVFGRTMDGKNKLVTVISY